MYDSYRDGDEVYGDEQSEWTVPPEEEEEEEEEEEMGRNVGGAAAPTVRPLNRSDSSTG